MWKNYLADLHQILATPPTTWTKNYACKKSALSDAFTGCYPYDAFSNFAIFQNMKMTFKSQIKAFKKLGRMLFKFLKYLYK